MEWRRDPNEEDGLDIICFDYYEFYDLRYPI